MSVDKYTFTVPADDIQIMTDLKLRCKKFGIDINKSEIVRAGWHALANLQDKELINLVESLSRIKTGRPPLANKNILEK